MTALLETLVAVLVASVLGFVISAPFAFLASSAIGLGFWDVWFSWLLVQTGVSLIWAAFGSVVK